MKHVLILGATSDIAQALAHEFARQGYGLTLAARRAERLEPSVSDLTIRYRVEAAAAEFDALDYAGHASFYAGLDPKPEVAICVFGYLGDQVQGQRDFTQARQIIDTNFTGAVSILNIIANDFEQRRSGTIIGLSSVAGDRGRQSNYLYGSAKAGFTAYLSGLRNRLYPAGVTVITARPGFVRTKMTEGLDLPPLLTASPEQVANDVFKAYQKGRDNVYSLWMWRYIMFLIKNLPEFVFKRSNL